MFHRRKSLHVGTDFGNDSDVSKVATDTGSGLENGKFLLIGSGELKNEFFKLCFPGFQAFIMSFNHLKFADLFRCDITVNSVIEFRKFLFQTFVNKGFKVKRCICGIFQKFIQYRLSRFAEGVQNNISQLDIGNRETVL